MAKQIINVGIEGNDGTGDSIRDVFRKSQRKFYRTLCCIWSRWTDQFYNYYQILPDTLGSNKVAASNADGTCNS